MEITAPLSGADFYPLKALIMLQPITQNIVQNTAMAIVF